MIESATERSLSQTTAPSGEVRPVLEMVAISKRFGATQALEDVSLALRPGEIHALLGENGAGKSTLIKIMTGVQQPDAGEIRVDGAAGPDQLRRRTPSGSASPPSTRSR